MDKILAFLLFSAAFAFAQLVPEGMVLQPADSSAPTPVVEQPAPVNMVEVPEGQSVNWNEPANPDSLKYYEVEAFRNTQDATRKHAISNVLLWVAGGIGVAGFGVFASGLFIEDEGRGRICRYVGEGLLVGALASVGFSYGFDISANGSRIKAQYYNQKLADYRKRHSAMGNE